MASFADHHSLPCFQTHVGPGVHTCMHIYVHVGMPVVFVTIPTTLVFGIAIPTSYMYHCSVSAEGYTCDYRSL